MKAEMEDVLWIKFCVYLISRAECITIWGAEEELAWNRRNIALPNS